MEKVHELEYEHAQIYNDLIQALDTLYLLKQNIGEVTPEMEKTLEIRRQLQRSLEKSASLLRTIERINVANERSQASESTEGLLASELGKIMQDNYDLDVQVQRFISSEDKLEADLQKETDKYTELVSRFKKLSSAMKERSAKLKSSEFQPSNPNLPSKGEKDEKDEDQRILDQNEVLQQLLLALKIHGGYDPFI